MIQKSVTMKGIQVLTSVINTLKVHSKDKINFLRARNDLGIALDIMLLSLV